MEGEEAEDSEVYFRIHPSLTGHSMQLLVICHGT